MAKVSTEDIEIQLKQLDAAPQLIDDLMARLNQLLEEEKAEKNAAPAIKYEYAIVGIGPRFDVEAPMFIVKIEEEDNHNDIPETIRRIAKRFNEEQSGKKARYRKNAIETVGEAFEVVSGKVAKEEGLTIVTKQPVIGVGILENDMHLQPEGTPKDA